MIDIRKEVAKILDEACKCAKNRFKTKVSIYDFGCVSRWKLDEDDVKEFGYLKTEEYYFRARGCPGWLFAIDACLVNEDRLDITACYGQYEDTIDKFRASHSLYKTTKDEDVTHEESFDGIRYVAWELAKILSFIHKHPALAYYRSNFSEFDTAFSTVGTIGATFIKLKNTIDTKIRTFITDCVTRYLCKCFIKQMKKAGFTNCRFVIADKGSNWSPRYEPTIIYDSEEALEEEFERRGLYGLDEWDLSRQHLLAQKIAKKAAVFYSEIGDYVMVTTKEIEHELVVEGLIPYYGFKSNPSVFYDGKDEAEDEE